jgi:alpha-L-rhamnosidase
MAEKTGTLWEHLDTRASCCHGFSSIAAEYLLRDVLGVKRIDRAGKTVEISPSEDMALEWCEGAVPVDGNGEITVKWRRDERGKIAVDAVLPPGWRRL